MAKILFPVSYNKFLSAIFNFLGFSFDIKKGSPKFALCLEKNSIKIFFCYSQGKAAVNSTWILSDRYNNCLLMNSVVGSFKNPRWLLLQYDKVWIRVIGLLIVK